MLSRKDYKELKKFRKGSIPKGECAREEYFLDRGYIEAADLGVREMSGIMIIGEALSYKLTDKGEDSLSEYEQHIRGVVFQIFLVLLAAAFAFIADRILPQLLG